MREGFCHFNDHCAGSALTGFVVNLRPTLCWRRSFGMRPRPLSAMRPILLGHTLDLDPTVFR